jgi:preprotein translocase subunit SecG
MKWVLIIGGGLVVLYLLNNRNQTSSGGLLSGGSKSSSTFSFNSAIDSLTKLTNSVGHLFSKEATTVTDPDGLATPNF